MKRHVSLTFLLDLCDLDFLRPCDLDFETDFECDLELDGLTISRILTFWFSLKM